MALQRLPFTTWLRVQRAVEGRDTACVLLASAAGVAQRRAASTLSLTGRTTWSGQHRSQPPRSWQRRGRARGVAPAARGRPAACGDRVRELPRGAVLMFAAVYAAEGSDVGVLVDVGRAFSPRVEAHLPREVVLDVDGLTRLFGDARTIAAEIRRTAADRKLRVRRGHCRLARGGAPAGAASRRLHRTRTRRHRRRRPDDRAAVAEVPIELLAEVMTPPPDGTTADAERVRGGSGPRAHAAPLGPAHPGRAGGAAARRRGGTAGRGRRPLVARGAWRRSRAAGAPVADERFEQSLDLDWPIEGLEPLSFVLGRLIEPLSAHLERRDRGVAVLHLRLRLVNKTVHEQSLQLPTPMRDPKALRTIALLALESNPPAAGIDRVTVTADPTPARVLQHSLLTRPVPMPEEIATLMARLNALMGEGRCGAPAVVDSWRPGAYAVAPFAPDTRLRLG